MDDEWPCVSQSVCVTVLLSWLTKQCLGSLYGVGKEKEGTRKQRFISQLLFKVSLSLSSVMASKRNKQLCCISRLHLALTQTLKKIISGCTWLPGPWRCPKAVEWMLRYRSSRRRILLCVCVWHTVILHHWDLEKWACHSEGNEWILLVLEELLCIWDGALCSIAAQMWRIVTTYHQKYPLNGRLTMLGIYFWSSSTCCFVSIGALLAYMLLNAVAAGDKRCEEDGLLTDIPLAIILWPCVGGHTQKSHASSPPALHPG